jgi:choline dehydrogenase-like flavoprotein
VACAQALLQRNVPVRMLDAGIELEPARAQLVRELSRVPSSSWRSEQVAVLKENMTSSAKGIVLKRVYGSDFPYRDTEVHLPARYIGVGMRPSLALGGFSNVWGAAMLPYAEADLEDWPVKNAELTAHYRAVLEMTGVAATHDGLEPLLPLHLPNPKALELSRQARHLLDRLESNRPALEKRGWWFGRARVAVRVARPPNDPGCVYCGFCMYGCPYGYIYNTADTVRQMKEEQNFSYVPNVIVTSLRESAGGVVIKGYNRVSGAEFSADASRVYLAGGVIPTTRILLHSMAAYDHPLRVMDSQYYLFPLLLARRTRDVQTEPLHTLSQLFIEFRNLGVSGQTVHLQVYSYNDLISQAVRKSFGPLARPLEFLARQLEERLLIVQGYLSSENSSSIFITLKKDAGRGPDYLDIRAQLNRESRPAIKRVMGEFFRHARMLGAVPLFPMLQVAEPGRSFHNGGSFPMRAQPGRFESDCLGRPHGWQRVHAVDATVFPSIPPTTITLSVMANAHRIGWEAAKLASTPPQELGPPNE